MRTNQTQKTMNSATPLGRTASIWSVFAFALAISLGACGHLPPSPPVSATATPAADHKIERSPSPELVQSQRPEPNPPSGYSTIPALGKDLVDAVFAIDSIEAETIRETGLFHEVRFSATVTNAGGSGGDFPVTVEASFNGAEPEIVHVIERASEGDQIGVFVDHRLGPGKNVLEFSVGGERAAIDYLVRSADLELGFLPYQVIEAKSILVRIEVANRGQIAAIGVQLWGSWDPAPPEYFFYNGLQAFIGDVAPGQVEVVEILAEVPTGRFEFEISANSSSLDSNIENNIAKQSIQIGFDKPHISLLGPPRMTFPAGGPVATLDFAIENHGEAAPGETKVGLVRRATVDRLEVIQPVANGLPICGPELTTSCWWHGGNLRLLPGETQTVSVSVPLSVGNHSLVAFAGSPANEFRLGNDSYHEFQIQVDAQPDIALVASISAELQGYWSDRSASVEITIELHNAGTRRVQDPQLIELRCRGDGFFFRRLHL